MNDLHFALYSFVVLFAFAMLGTVMLGAVIAWFESKQVYVPIDTHYWDNDSFFNPENV